MKINSLNKQQEGDQLRLIRKIKSSLCLVQGLQIESLTQRLCSMIFSKNNEDMSEKLQLSHQNPVGITMWTIRQLKHSLQQKNILIDIRQKKKHEMSRTMEFDWNYYTCIIWNQMMSIIQELQTNRVIIVELSIYDGQEVNFNDQPGFITPQQPDEILSQETEQRESIGGNISFTDN